MNQHSMHAIFCDSPFISIRKCSDDDEYINLRYACMLNTHFMPHQINSDRLVLESHSKNALQINVFAKF